MMKIVNSIFIAIILIFIVFVVKTNYKTIYSNVVPYIQNVMDSTSSVYKSKYKDKLDKVVVTLSNDIKKEKNVQTPGALVVPDSFLIYATNKIKLVSENVISITNKYRSEIDGLPPLVENPKLNFSAEKKLQDMFIKGYFEHISPTGVGVSDLGKEVGYEYILIGENLAMGNFKDDTSLVDAWMASPGHRANILNNRYTEIGVSVAKGDYNGETIWMAVQHFGLPTSACPSISQVLSGMIDFDQNKIKQMEGDLSDKRSKIDSGAVSEGMTTNGQIDVYNNLVKEYNNLIVEIKTKINNYNKQVRDFNNCVEGV